MAGTVETGTIQRHHPPTCLENENTVPFPAHILGHPDHLRGSPARIAKVVVIEPLVLSIVADPIQRGVEVTAVGQTAPAWTKVKSPNTEDH